MLREQSGWTRYPSDLNEAQWEYIRNLLPKARSGGRPRTTDLRAVLNGILYVVNTGCAWGYLPAEFPPFKTVYHYFSQWRNDGVWEGLVLKLNAFVRKQMGKHEVPSVLIIDSQSVRASSGEALGYDGFKRIRGRKRHVLVDTLGLIQQVDVHAADQADTIEGARIIRAMRGDLMDQVSVVVADLGYMGSFERACEECQIAVPLKKRKHTGQGKKKSAIEKKLWKRNREKIHQKHRWIVERTFAWLNGYRRLARDYEKTILSSIAMIYLAMIQLLLRRCFS